MNIFYEEEGVFKVASIMSESPGSMQVESPGGKRSKIKTANVLMRFDNAPAGFMEAAQQEAEGLETDFLWECCGEAEFGFQDLAREYYGKNPSPVEAAAIAIKLHGAPVYFYRKGKGIYKSAPPETLKAALAALERKRLQAEKIARDVEQLKAKQLPEDFRDKLDMLLYQPDKNSAEYKALDQASHEAGMSQLKLLDACGAIPSAHDYHLGAFLREYFPKGSDFGEYESISVPENIEFAETEAFSIDDSTTTEIDDALSVQKISGEITRVGIHIAAPALGIAVDGLLDRQAMKRLSTVYMPGHKITMLPEEVIRPFSLDAGEIKPVLSLYLDVAADYSIVNRHSRVERVKIVENLRHDTLEPFFNEGNCHTDNGHPYWEKLNLLFNLAESLEKARGKYDPSKAPQLDYNFYVTDGIVSIVARHRGSPMDKVVAELMIEANSQWGKLLADNRVPGIYRAQNNGKVYMTTQAEPHQGLGVAQYAWSTSPLRRAVDLVNQRQIVSVLQGADPAYPAGSDDLTSIMRNFDLTYNAYADFQERMERYWCLQYLIQESITEIGATVWRENLVRLDNLPYITKVHSLPETKAGTRVALEVKRVEPLLMELDCRFKAILEEKETAAHV